MTDMPPVAILCGGKGTRLGELTKDTPKSLVKVAGEPFIFHQLRLLKKWGVKRVVLCVGHLGLDISQAVKRSFDGLIVDYSWDHDGREFEPIGTMAAIRKAAPMLGDEFVTLYGDSWLPDFDLARFVEFGREHSSGVAQAVDFADRDYGMSYLRGNWSALVVGTGIGDLRFNRVCALYSVSQAFHQIGDPDGLADVEALLAPKQEAARRLRAVSDFTVFYLNEVKHICDKIDPREIENVVDELVAVRNRGGRLFCIGLGGSAANASHAVNDARKIAHIEAYAPTDAVAEWSAWGNDNGWRTPFAEYLKTSNATAKDLLMVFSVGGGMTQAPATSVSISFAVQLANQIGMPVVGVVGRDGGYTREHATATVLIPTVNERHITPHAESFAVLLLHLFVNHPALIISR